MENIELFKGYVRRLLPGIFTVILSFFLAFAAEAAEGNKNKKEEVKTITIEVPEEKQEKKNLATYIHYQTEFSKSLVDLKDKTGNLVDPEKYQEQIKGIAQRLDQLEWQIQMAKTDLNIRHDMLSALDVKLHREELALKKIGDPLTKSIQQLSDWEVEWSDRKKELAEWKKAIPPESTFSLVLKNIDELNKTTVGALEGINNRLKPAIEAGQKISKLQVKTYTLNVAVGVLIDETQERGFEQTAPRIFSKQFVRLFNFKLFQTTVEGVKNVLYNLQKVARDHSGFFLTNVLGVLLLAAAIKYSGRNLTSSVRWYYFTKRPLSVSFFFFLLFFLFFNVTLIGTPINLEIMLQVFLSLAVLQLTGVFIKYSSREIWFLRSLSALLIVTWLCRVVAVPAAFMQLFATFISFCMILYCLWQSWDLEKKKENKLHIIGLRFAVIPLAVICIGMTGGYEKFAIYIFTSLLVGIVAAKVVVLIYLIATGVLELFLLSFPVKLIRENNAAIVERLAPIVGFFSGVSYLLIILKEWQIYPTREVAAKALFAMSFTLGDVTISPGLILVSLGTVYAVFMISQAIQKVLLKGVFPRYRVEHGVQLSMVRLVHYSILVVGFIVLLNILGFELTKLTILGGALGVGIGFGLQAIVNNFASGLILLFERPIKVGDTVQVGDDLGVVKNLGLRATVVRTVDDAEIVIPNSDLITAPVTNWTLSGRQVRVKVPVGVAYGSDIQKVLEILMTCAKEHPLVLTQPHPKALFLSFGASSLDFQLRVWIPDFSDRRQVLSELNQEIESEFSMADIEIPFPQTDLHLRSVDEGAAATFNRGA